MGDRPDPPRLRVRRHLRHHGAHRLRKDHHPGRRLFGPLRPDPPAEPGDEKRQRDHVPPDGGVLCRGDLQDGGGVLPVPLEPAPGAEKAGRRTPGPEARNRRRRDGHPLRVQNPGGGRADRGSHRNGFRPVHPVHAPGPGRLRRLPAGGPGRTGPHLGADYGYGNLQPHLHGSPRTPPGRAGEAESAPGGDCWDHGPAAGGGGSPPAGPGGEGAGGRGGRREAGDNGTGHELAYGPGGAGTGDLRPGGGRE